MTLYKQLVIGIVSVFLLLLIAIFSIEFHSTQQYLLKQQESEIHNTINTVGLALSPYLKEEDKVAVESVINALFDGSSYSTVRLTFLETGDEIVRSYPIQASNTPDWFTQLNFFTPIHDKRVLTSGWMQLAEVEIISHPGQAYAQLWALLQRLCYAFGIILVVGLLSVSLLVKHALAPLKAISNKMQMMAKHQFDQELPLPNTADLIPVVEGINYMSHQLENSFKQQAQEAEQLRERAYMDPVSRLGNRAFFMGQLQQWINDSAQGGLLLLKASYIQDAYENQSYDQADQEVAELASQLQNIKPTSDTIMARLSKDEFAFIIPNVDEARLHTLTKNLRQYIQNLRPDPIVMAPQDIFIGAVFNQRRVEASVLLSHLDNALSQALSQPESNYGFISEEKAPLAFGKQQWLTKVQEAIHNEDIKFRYQAANNSDRQTFHKEVLSEIKTSDYRYTANQYLFALEQLKSGHIYDQFVIQTMINKLLNQEFDHAIAINLTSSAIEQPSFVRWLSKTLSKCSKIADKLHFEIPEVCFIEKPHFTALVCNTIREHGAKFGVDQYGHHFHSLQYIKEFYPDYVKLDYLYTHQIDDEKQRFTLTSISRTARNLGITTIASRVETTAQLEFLAEHYIEVFQGFIVDE